MSGDGFIVMTRSCYWFPEGRNQGCYLISYSAQPPTTTWLPVWRLKNPGLGEAAAPTQDGSNEWRSGHSEFQVSLPRMRFWMSLSSSSVLYSSIPRYSLGPEDKWPSLPIGRGKQSVKFTETTSTGFMYSLLCLSPPHSDWLAHEYGWLSDKWNLTNPEELLW